MMRPDTFPWWRPAEADLECAEVLQTAERHYGASWFAHQSAEKALKAPYVEQAGRPANRVHDLNFLGRTVSAPPPIWGDLALLDSAFTLTRYPDESGQAPVDTITASISALDLEAARRIVRWVQSQL